MSDPVELPDDSIPELAEVRLPTAERLALNACAQVSGDHVLSCSVGRGQCAQDIATRSPASQVVCHFFDLFAMEESQEFLTAGSSNLSVVCTPDLPEGPIDLFVLPLARGGESELARDLLQQGYDRLQLGGTLIATVDHPKDSWLHHEIEKFARNLRRVPKRQGVVYRVTKQKPLKKLRNFRCEFAFRDGERLIKAVSRPGVFSHRRLDLGARALIESMTINAGERVLDIGCGTGTVGLAAALRANNVSVHAVDSHARAIQCTQQGALLNELTDLTTQLTAEGTLEAPNSFDVALGNPPYYSHFQIAEIFLQTALRGLRPGGRILMVTKHPEWLQARMEQLFACVVLQERRGYWIVQGSQRSIPNA